MYSFVESREFPSAIFDGIDIADRRSWSPIANNSYRGKDRCALYTRFASSIDFFHTVKSRYVIIAHFSLFILFSFPFFLFPDNKYGYGASPVPPYLFFGYLALPLKMVWIALSSLAHQLKILCQKDICTSLI